MGKKGKKIDVSNKRVQPKKVDKKKIVRTKPNYDLADEIAAIAEACWG